jgi:hypothetical protein
MGVTVTEEVKLGVGLSINSYYISLNENEVRIQRRQERDFIHTEEGGHQEVLKAPKFRVEAGFTKWISKAAKDAGNGDIGRTRITLELDAAPTGNIYEVVYNKLKEGLTNYVDA